MSSRIASSMARLLRSPLVCSPSRLRAYLSSKAALIGRMSRRVSEMASMCLPPSSTPARDGSDVGVVGEHVPRAPDDVLECGERHEVLDQRAAVLGALAQADRAHLRQAADRQAHAPFDQLDAGDQGGRHRTEPDREHAEAARGGGDSWRRWCRHGGQAKGSDRQSWRPARNNGLLASRRDDTCEDARRRCVDGRAGLRDEIVDRLRSTIEAAGSPPVLPGHGTGRQRRPEPALRQDEAREGGAGRHRPAATRRSPPTPVRRTWKPSCSSLAEDPSVHGILVQLPLPAGLDEDAVLSLIPAEKDVDGLDGRVVRPSGARASRG